VATSTPEPTPFPSPTPTPEPASWALLDQALAAGDVPTALSIVDADSVELAVRGLDSFAGLGQLLDDAYPDRLRSIDQLVVDRDFEAATDELNTLLGWFPDRPQLLDRKRAVAHWSTQVENAVEWTETVPHLFIHSLITDTDKVFDGDYTDAGYRAFMITRTEFERSLDQLHANGFVLVDAHDLYDQTADGIEPRPLMVPPGKTPLVFSIDDVSYYSYMATDGFPDRLEVDEELNVATVMVDDDGTERLTLDGDAMPILDRFVWDHPDFSLGGAKGILALTGYEGVFGYDISADQLDEPDIEQRRHDAQTVATRLRELGWDFSDRWRDDIEPYLGDVDIYISPFGFDLSERNPRLQYLIDDMGFNAFMPISHNAPMTYRDGYLRMYRTALDGYMLRQAPQLLERFLDAETVLDEARFE